MKTASKIEKWQHRNGNRKYQKRKAGEKQAKRGKISKRQAAISGYRAPLLRLLASVKTMIMMTR